MANIYKNAKVDLTTTDNTTVYTVPSDSRAIIKSILVSEDAGSGTTVTFTITDAAAAVFNLFKDKSIASTATTDTVGVTVNGNFVYLRARVDRSHLVATVYNKAQHGSVDKVILLI